MPLGAAAVACVRPAEAAAEPKLSAYLAMVPAADFLSDCALFSVLLQGAQYTWALAVGLIIVLFFRFQSLYAALGPKPTFANVAMLYVPGVLLVAYPRIMELSVGNANELYEAALKADEHALDASMDMEAAGGATAAIAEETEARRQLSQNDDAERKELLTQHAKTKVLDVLPTGISIIYQH